MFDTVQQRDAKEAQRVAKEEAAFAKFMAKQETKLMLSLVPASNPPEAIETLLKAAFKEGASTGGSEILGMVFEAMLKDKPGRD